MNTWGYSLQGCGAEDDWFPRWNLGLLSRVASYCVSHSTPSGLWCRGRLIPQVPPGAIISRRFPRFHLGLFIFNPFRVGASLHIFPQVPPGAIHIQPFQGCFGLFFLQSHLGYFTNTIIGITKHDPYINRRR